MRLTVRLTFITSFLLCRSIFLHYSCSSLHISQHLCIPYSALRLGACTQPCHWSFEESRVKGCSLDLHYRRCCLYDTADHGGCTDRIKIFKARGPNQRELYSTGWSSRSSICISHLSNSPSEPGAVYDDDWLFRHQAERRSPPPTIPGHKKQDVYLYSLRCGDANYGSDCLQTCRECRRGFRLLVLARDILRRARICLCHRGSWNTCHLVAWGALCYEQEFTRRKRR